VESTRTTDGSGTSAQIIGFETVAAFAGKMAQTLKKTKNSENNVNRDILSAIMKISFFQNLQTTYLNYLPIVAFKLT